MRILLTRPDADDEPDELQTGLAEQGHSVVSAPLLTIRHASSLPPLDGVQAIIVTSRNALRAVAKDIAPALGRKLFAVGPATAALAREMGFEDVIQGDGGARALLPLIEAAAEPNRGPLLHLTGDKIAFDLASPLAECGLTVSREIVYRAEPTTALPPAIEQDLHQGRFGGVVLMSPRTARIYAALAGPALAGDVSQAPIHFCLSPAVAQELTPLGSVKAEVASSPNSQEMLALIGRVAPDSS